MKPKIPLWLSVLICLVLVAFGLVYGDVSGFQDERAQVNALLEGENGLLTVLGYRASDALNLCVVADRHLPGDADTAALRGTAEAVRSQQADPAMAKVADDTLTADFHTVAAKLAALPGFGGRDAQYLAMLSADFNQYGQHEIFKAYNQAAAAFNQKLATPLLGDLARFFGVKPCPAFA
jgi:hypothetical protein